MKQLRLSVPLIGGPVVIIEENKVKEVRLALPVIGGVVAIYTAAELQQAFRKLFGIKPKPEMPETPSPYTWDDSKRCYVPRVPW
jgi:hypothetical protein